MRRGVCRVVFSCMKQAGLLQSRRSAVPVPQPVFFATYENIMNYLLNGARPAGLVAALASALLLSACSLANDPIHQQNMADLARLEACGWYPKAFDPFYPGDLQEAEERSRRGECGTTK
jgi:hypothetical protein